MIEAKKTVLRRMPDGIGFVVPSEDQMDHSVFPAWSTRLRSGICCILF